jgi:hypothetical protein
LQTPYVAFFYRKTCPPSKIPLGQHPIPHLLPKNIVLMPTPRPAIGTSKMRRIAVQPCKSTQTDHHCQAKTEAYPSARSLADIQGHSYAQFYTSSQIPSPSGQLLCPIFSDCLVSYSWGRCVSRNCHELMRLRYTDTKSITFIFNPQT